MIWLFRVNNPEMANQKFHLTNHFSPMLLTSKLFFADTELELPATVDFPFEHITAESPAKTQMIHKYFLSINPHV